MPVVLVLHAGVPVMRGHDLDVWPAAPEPVAFGLGYRAELDGLRAVAVLAVMLHHSGLLAGGWLGVDVFFALSGFLITALLLDEHARCGRVALGRFWARRALRLLPALGVLLAVCGPVTILLSPPELVWNRVWYVVAVAGYVANWALIGGLPLFAFGHTWSLAIEEQFYLLWPPALLLALRGVRQRGALALLVALAAGASAAWRTALLDAGSSTARLFAGLDTRADSLLVGCALAMALAGRLGPPLAGRAGRAAGGVAAAVLVALLVTARYPADFRERFVTTAAAAATAVLIAAVLAPGSGLARVLRARPLVAVGRRSYGLYLWHFPIFLAFGVLVGRSAGLDPARLALAWLATFAVCAVSFRLVEAPALRLKSRFASPAAAPLPGSGVPVG